MGVRDGLLSLLAGGPSYGFQLKTRFEEATGDTWALNVGQVYTTLDRLERDGLVEVDEDGEQKVYRLTGAGDLELEQWWTAVSGDDPPPRDELLLKILMALPRGRDHALDVVTRQRSALLDLLARRQRDAADRRRAHSEGPPISALAADLVADALVMRLDADIRWLDRCEAKLLHADEGSFSLDEAGRSEPEPDVDTTPRPTTRRTRSARAKATRR